MRPNHPLSEILEQALRLEEPVLDTEWPAGELAVAAPRARFEERVLVGTRRSEPGAESFLLLR